MRQTQTCQKHSKQTPAEMASCAMCDADQKPNGGNLSKCSRCKKVAYCSAGCQRKHWKTHKQTCFTSEEAKLRKEIEKETQHTVKDCAVGSKRCTVY